MGTWCVSQQEKGEEGNPAMRLPLQSTPPRVVCYFGTHPGRTGRHFSQDGTKHTRHGADEYYYYLFVLLERQLAG
eukprot:scaffold353_cov185-Amphora_coffeaeformis.AAC.19